YNREDCIGRCIESVLNQNYPFLEYWIVDDGSRDSTSSVIDVYAQKYPCIRFRQFEKNHGVNAARNHAIQNSTGDFVIFLDSDDAFADNALNTINKEILSRPDYLHYLFAQNDRMDYYNSNPLLNKEINEVYFADFLTGRIFGDFAHVISRPLLQSFPFNEELRIYEYINFLKIFKEEQKQLYIKKVIALRERNRLDSVTKTSQLKNNKALKNQYIALKETFALFADDYLEAGAKDSLNSHIKRQYLLGTALGLYEEDRNLKVFAKKHEIQIPFVYKFLSRLKLGFFLKTSIFAFSTIKNKLKKSE
ncbi:MAG: glycosyltransferase, partial [Tannerella sp.]|nr:glycosyltransferase [Tannerella sp.]